MPILCLWERGFFSERPRSLLLSLGGAIQTLAWVLSWARPGPIPGSRWSRPDSPCALRYSVSDPSRSRGGGHPGPSWSHPAPERSLQDRAWTGRNRLLGHFRSIIRKVLVSVNFLSAILGPEMAAPSLWAPGKMCSFFRRKNSCP